MAPENTDRVLRPGETCWRIAPARRFAALIDGADYFEAFAAAVRRATRSVYVASWDIDSRIALQRGADEESSATELCDLFERCLAQRTDLEIQVLNWDYALLYALEREMLPERRSHWNKHDRLHFRLDSEHPPGASHHQKFVVIDDALAFVGGLDLTRRRWDTRDHAAHDPRRTDHAGRSYLPFHDVQAMVDGKAAAALGELFRLRWATATGERLKAPGRDSSDPWPPGVPPDLRGVEIAIARTRASHRGRPAVREVEELHLAAIAQARHSLFIENPYFTSASICEALRERLIDPAGPEVVLVLPDRSDGWLEEHTMNALRVHFLERLRAADRHDRLAVYFPRVPGVANVNVHSKLLIADDRFLKIGSANLTNRSMSLDSECDLAMEANGDEEIAAAIAGLRHRLLAEHLDLTPERVRQRAAACDSLQAAVEELRGRGRTLVPIEPEATDWAKTALDHISIIDPEQPIRPERFVAEIGSAEVKRWSGWRIAGLIALLLSFGGLALAWNATPLGEWIDLARLTAWASQLETTPWTWPLVPLGMALLCGLMFPVTPLFFATAAVFDPLPATVLSMAGCLAAATVNFAAGRWLGLEAVRRIAGRRVERLSRRLARRGIVNVALVRLLPVSPFPVVNLVLGASQVRLRDYLIGTAIGMAPGIVLICLLTDLARGLIQSASPARAVVLTGLVLVVVAIVWAVRRRISRPTATGPDDDAATVHSSAIDPEPSDG